MSSEKYKNHYRRYLDVYRELATVGDSKTMIIPTDAHDGWYVTESVTEEDEEAWNNGYPYKSRPRILPDDLSEDIERTVYTTNTYAPDESYKQRYYKRTNDDENSREWMDNNDKRLPSYGDIESWAIFVDIDIKGEYKSRPLNDKKKQIIKSRLQNWIDIFEKMSGSIDSVKILDSGGGIYVFVAPSALKPISEEFDKEERNHIFREIGNRFRKLTEVLDTLICRQDDGPDELFAADAVMNKNRQYKTIGSIHKDLDAVVNPIDPDKTEINHLKIDDIDEEDIENAHEWAKEFTAEKHSECVGNIVEYLFQGEFIEKHDFNFDHIDGNSWVEILEKWVEKKKEEISSWRLKEEEIENIDDVDIDVDITQDKKVAQAALLKVNNEKLRDYIVDYVGGSRVYNKPGSEMDFFPFWRSETTESGRSAFYDYYEGKSRFTDKSDGSTGGIARWVALEMTYDNKNYPDKDLIKSPGEKLEGKDFVTAIKELRRRGEDIPILVPAVSEDDISDKLGDEIIANIGTELGIINEEDTYEENGKTKIKSESFNEMLDYLDDNNITHNRDRKKEDLLLKDMTMPNTKSGQLELESIISSSYLLPYNSDIVGSRDEANVLLDNISDGIYLFNSSEIQDGEKIMAARFEEPENNNEKLIVKELEPHPEDNIDSILNDDLMKTSGKTVIYKKNINIFVSDNKREKIQDAKTVSL